MLNRQPWSSVISYLEHAVRGGDMMQHPRLLSQGVRRYTEKKVIDFPIPSRNVTDQTLPDREKKLFPASDIPAGDGKIDNFFTV